MHRGSEHVVNGKDRKPRSLALIKTLRARNRLKRDDAEPRATEPLYRVAIEESVRAPEFDIECADPGANTGWRYLMSAMLGSSA